MKSNRLPWKSYRMLYQLDINGKKTWASDVRCKLYEMGFGFVWVNQGVENDKLFLRVFKERLVICRWQEWHFHIEDSDTFSFYRTFCTVHDAKNYLIMDLDTHLKRVLSRFRLGISGIAKHSLRYRAHSDVDLVCPLCKGGKEDELHFVLCCPALLPLRERYIPKKFYRYPNLFKLSLLMATINEDLIRNLSLYLFKAFNLRSVLIS